MPYLSPSKRLDPTIDDVEDFLYELGSPSDGDREIILAGVEVDISKVTRQSPMRLEVTFDHPGASRYINSLKQFIWKELKQYYNMPYPDTLVKGYKALPFGYKSAGTYTILNFNVIRSQDSVGGTMPTEIQEEGTTVILNATLKDNVKFSTDDTKRNVFADGRPIKQHKIYKALEKLFGNPFKHRIEDWLWTYYQQNKVFLNEYGQVKWDPFLYKEKSFVKFFTDHMNKMERESGIKAGNYTTWNPSDIWAVKGMDKVRGEIDTALKRGTLIEMNSKLIQLMERKELIGISLKMVKSKKDAFIKLHNVETSDALKALGKVHIIEEYDMSDISFRYNNIWEGDSTSVLTVVKIGPTDKYEINISKSGNNLSFNTKVKGAAAQAGQTPIDMVVSMLKGKEFKKNHNDYPQTPEKLIEQSDRFEKMYNVVSKNQGAPTWNQYQLYWENVYKKNKRTAVLKLMQLSFWYDAITKYSKDAEFWTDLLYTGMKIKPGREFAPHAKIS